jgi:ABC-type glycerol-3-phosphate transport system substrate-binding protein
MAGSAVAFSLAGCGATAEPTKAPSVATAVPAAPTAVPATEAPPVTINYWTPAGVRFGKPNEALIAEYKKIKPNVTIEMVTTPVGDYFPKVATEIGAGTANVDLFQCIAPFVGAFASGGKIVNMEELLPKEDIADLVSDIPVEYLNTFRYDGGPLYGVPNDSNVQWSFYRTDLFEAAGLKPAEKWEDAAAICKALTKDGVYGFTASYRRGEYAGAHWSTTFWSYGGEWWDADFNPTINNETGKKSLEIMIELLDYADPGTINAGEDDTIGVMGSGVAAYAPILWGNSALTNAEITQFAQQMGTAVCPKGLDHDARPMLGGLSYMITGWSEKKQEAADYVRFATAKKVGEVEVGQIFVANTGQPARTSVLNDPVNAAFAPYFPTLSQSLKQGHAQVTIAESYACLDSLGNEIALALTKEKSIDQALADAEKGWVEILKAGGHLK